MYLHVFWIYISIVFHGIVITIKIGNIPIEKYLKYCIIIITYS